MTRFAALVIGSCVGVFALVVAALVAIWQMQIDDAFGASVALCCGAGVGWAVAILSWGRAKVEVEGDE